jgi:peptidoglycan hydrolase-like protein with peptidoglycan-binding domain
VRQECVVAEVFISYAREDRGTATRLADALAARGLQVWWDRNLVLGRDYDRDIERELTQARAVLVVWSPDSVESDWVRAEASEAADRKRIVPVRIRQATVPIRFRNIEVVDLDAWDGTAQAVEIERIVHAIGMLPPMVRATPLPTPQPVVVAHEPTHPITASRPGTARADDAAPPKRRRTRLPLLVAAVVAVLGVVAAVIVIGSGTGKSTDSTTSVAEPPTTEETSPPDTAADCARLLRRGCQGDTVRTLQELLVAVGLDPGAPDGDFGRLTEAALREFEHSNAVPVDGTIVPAGDVWNRLVVAAQQAATTTSAAATTKVTVPNVVNLPPDDATSKLAGNFTAQIKYLEVPFGDPRVNRVISQSPAAGSQVAKGTTVLLIVGKQMVPFTIVVRTTSTTRR